MNFEKTLILHKLKNENFLVTNISLEKQDQNIFVSLITHRALVSFFLNSLLPFIFFSNNLFFIQQIFNKNTSINIFSKNIKNSLKGLNQVFFLEFRIIGLGYKIYKFRRSLDSRIIIMKLGFSHLIKYAIPKNFHLITGKRRLLIYTNDFQTLRIIYKHLFFLKKPNVYKLKGLVEVRKEVKLKQGKQQKR